VEHPDGKNTSESSQVVNGSTPLDMDDEPIPFTLTLLGWAESDV
jgi:hypothetical protein